MSEGRFFPLSDEALALLAKLSLAKGKTREEMLEELIRTAASEAGLTEPPEGAFLELQSVEETAGIGPEGRVRRVRFKAVDETGEQDLGDFVLPDDPNRRKPNP